MTDSDKKAKAKHSGLSLKETEALFGAEGMSVVQQGVELLRRGKRIEQLEGELEQAKRECRWEEIHVVARTAARNYFMRRAEKAEAELAIVTEQRDNYASQYSSFITCLEGQELEQVEAENVRLRKACKVCVKAIDHHCDLGRLSLAGLTTARDQAADAVEPANGLKQVKEES